MLPMLSLVRKELIRHAKECYPHEAGGLVLQYQDNGLIRQIPLHIPNVHSRPDHNYAGEARSTIEAYQMCEDHSDLRGFFAFQWHSHPLGPAEPSEIDVATYHVPDRLVIVSLANLDFPEVEAFRIISGNSSSDRILDL